MHIVLYLVHTKDVFVVLI